MDAAGLGMHMHAHKLILPVKSAKVIVIHRDADKIRRQHLCPGVYTVFTSPGGVQHAHLHGLVAANNTQAHTSEGLSA